MYKLIKLSDTHYIVVSKDKSTEIHNIIASTEQLEDTSGGVKTIPLEEVKELLGIPTRSKVWGRALENYFPDYASHRDILDRKDQKILDAFSDGYWAALADNKDKQYTKEDMKRAYYLGHGDGYELCDGQQCYSDSDAPNNEDTQEDDKQNLKDFEDSLLPKTEWDVEFDSNGKLKLI